MLELALGPAALYEVAVVTDIGVRAPDVVWMPAARWAQADLSEPLCPVPDICVEVLSPGNRPSDIAHKTDAYLRAGAKEVLVVSLTGAVEFSGQEGQRAQSAFGLKPVIPKSLL